MPPRAIWTGTISFGLVNVPVRMYAAVSEHELHFNLLHARTSPIGYEKVCKKEDKPVPDDEIVKAFEYREGRVRLHRGRGLRGRARRGLQRRSTSTDFVPYEDIDPIYFEHSYYLGPAGGRREGLRAARASDGGRPALAGDREVRHARPPAPRRAARPRRRDHARAACTSPTRSGAAERDQAPKGAQVEQAGARDGARLIEPLPRRLRPEEVQGHVPRRAPRRDQGASGRARRSTRHRRSRARRPADLMEALSASLEARSKTPASRRKAPARRKSPSTRRPSRRSSARR